MDGSSKARRLFKKTVQQGRSERRGDAYSVPYVEPLGDARTPLADFFNSLLALRSRRAIHPTFHATQDRGVPDGAGHSLARRMYEQDLLLLFAANQPPRADKAPQCWIARPDPLSVPLRSGYRPSRPAEP